MKSPSHFSKSKLKDGNQTNRIQNFKIEINYISSLSNKKESSYRQNNPLFNEKNICCTDNEFPSLSNVKFLSSENTRNCASKISSHTTHKKKKSVVSLNSNRKYMNGERTPKISLKLPGINSKSRSRTKLASLFTSSNNNNDKHNSCHHNSIIKNKSKYLDIKRLNNEYINDKVSRTPKVSKCNFKINNISGANEKKKALKNSLFLNYAQNYTKSPKTNFENTNINCLDYYNDIGKMFKISENIQNEIESKELQKKVNLMKS